MTTYLLTWNPNRWPWMEFELARAQVQSRGSLEDRWSCGTQRSIRAGSEFFLLRLGVFPRGIIAHGLTSAEPSAGDPRHPGRMPRGKPGYFVDVEFDHIAASPLIGWEELQRGRLKDFHWRTSGSAVALPQPVAEELSLLWQQRCHVPGRPLDPDAADDAQAASLAARTDLGASQLANLLKARRGQGAYRDALERIEQQCRLTGLLDRRHLRACHIKPWREASDAEKLDGFNGLLLSPHLAQLFERGHLSFEDDGRLLISRYLNPVVLETWRIDRNRSAGPFQPEQQRYLAYHRAQVFERQDGRRRAEADATSGGTRTAGPPDETALPVVMPKEVGS